MGSPATTEPTVDAAVAARVEAQWQLHELAVDLPSAVRPVVTYRQAGPLRRLADELPAFHEWSGHTPATLALYEQPENRQRLAWLLNMIDAGERVVDIGPGSGSIGGRVLRFREPQHYAAIEPSSTKTAAFRGMAAENGIDPTRFELHEATTEQVGATVIGRVQPTLVLILEVLEHVRDPGGILADVATAMPEECDLVISVPVIGCIEHEWGHYSVFDRARIERLAHDAGLHIHWVQPIADQWLFVVLSKSVNERPRLQRLTGDDVGPLRETAAEESAYFWKQVPLGDASATVLAESTTITRAPRRPDGALAISFCGGQARLRIDTGPCAAVRVRVRTSTGSAIAGVAAEFGKRDATVERWELADHEVNKASDTATWVFRRGFDFGRRHDNMNPGGPVDRLDLIVGGARGRQAVFELLRVEQLAAIDNPTQPQAPHLRYPNTLRPSGTSFGERLRVLAAEPKVAPRRLLRKGRRYWRQLTAAPPR